MMKLIFGLLFVLFSTPILACIPLVTQDGTQVTINSGGNIAVFNYDSLGNGSVLLKAGRLAEALQAMFDNRQALTSIPLDDPDRFANPDTPTLYWGDADGNPIASLQEGATHLISRCVIVEDVFWDGVNYVISWRRP
jgi:hypothetical protein